ncbi:bifunctional aminoglycoside phosphotransferase/ATP-binding protein [Mycobacterium sp. TY814]|uniref:bifunctional aminoglycoside phosphotransferase/ATP-binding protein n=1 Tax=unclassified Mycobacterium TaxID=2642494 RepID=UPI002740F02E|nr:bifunctional aminoglycoside phosphotransferase/ATP-binding protein [Mycobacterium sp. TY814]MDP7724113.1 AAA family ATPase [Mycobacterium sp. TY814]
MELAITAECSTDSTTAPFLDVRETHTGVVVLAGDRAYKAKKPVLTDFVDFRTTEERERACRREVELNRRLSPEAYLGVAHLSDPAGGAAEPIVVMRRYRDQDRLAFLLGHKASGECERLLDAIAAVLTDFHSRAERSPLISIQGEAGAVDQRWRANLNELHQFTAVPGVTQETVTRIERLAAEYVSGRGRLFARRIDEDSILDGHGDLLADDIFFVDGQPVLLDCLEFDDQLRYLDRIDDAAFLAMDLEFLGRRDLGDHFMARYVALTGDAAPPSLQHFYIAYRAGVRAKVDCVRFLQGRQQSADDAARHLAIAAEHLTAGAVRLVLIGGNPGSGKSTVARGLAEQVGAQVISTDDVRRELRESGAISGSPGVLDSGLYSPDNVAAVYETVLHRARVLLHEGRSVILDGTWQDPGLRAQARRMAGETHARIAEIVCAVPVETSAGRIEHRAPGNSDATPDIAAALAARRDAWESAYRMDTSQPLDASVAQAYEVWSRATDDTLHRKERA